MDVTTTPDRSRRDGIEAVPIPLADGNRWGLALPSTRLKPEFVEGVDALGRPVRTTRLVSRTGYPPEIRALIEALRSASDQGHPQEQYDALIQLAAALVHRAHEIDLESARSLVEVGVEDLPGLVEVVLTVVTGGCPADPEPMRKVKVDG
jgi:hypothetical protein